MKTGLYGITYPKGFYAASAAVGLQKNRDDMAMICSEVPAVCAVLTTTNKVFAAPVRWDREIIEKSPMKRAVVINSGNANACTGEQGYQDSVATAATAAALLDVNSEDVLVSSTGVIGVPMPMDKILCGVEKLAKSLNNTAQAGDAAAHAILTTDTVAKTASAEFCINGRTIRLGGMAKGSGMIRPNMATMLSYVTTDASVDAEVLRDALLRITEDTYNMISVDGDMSTNDTVVVMANGLAENETITSLNSPEGKLFYEALYNVNEKLATDIVRDGEGAGKFIEVQVSGAKNKNDARALARSVAESSLVKTAIFGEDANWGRVLCALGYAEADFNPDASELVFESANGALKLFSNGVPLPFSEEEAAKILAVPEIHILVNMHLGEAKATAWGCDLSYEYVKINGEYRS